MDHLTLSGSALFCVAGIVWLKGPRRSELWRQSIAGVDWIRARMEDAMLARVMVEDRRDMRRLMRSVERPAQLETRVTL
jgi:hypothetical protein